MEQFKKQLKISVEKSTRKDILKCPHFLLTCLLEIKVKKFMHHLDFWNVLIVTKKTVTIDNFKNENLILK